VRRRGSSRKKARPPMDDVTPGRRARASRGCCREITDRIGGDDVADGVLARCSLMARAWPSRTDSTVTAWSVTILPVSATSRVAACRPPRRSWSCSARVQCSSLDGALPRGTAGRRYIPYCPSWFERGSSTCTTARATGARVTASVTTPCKLPVVCAERRSADKQVANTQHKRRARPKEEARFASTPGGR